ncbi:MAG: hypothetical protein PHF97_05070 [Bacteroidales bacterium]|nr:hypothetical protein [Bacteroidales bacterium]MDD4603157.1 hypothetical protein [Bacteroidales bacterium]
MKTTLLEPGKYYHVYNRAKNGDPLFEDESAYLFFMKLYQKHVTPIAETYAYCLLHDHLHLLIRIKEDANGSLYRPFALLFNSYSKGYNTRTGKEGRVFKFKMKRIEIRNMPYFREMIRFINQNPRYHGATEFPADYRFSSFHSTITTGQSMVAKEKILDQFGSRENMTYNLQTRVNEDPIRMFLMEE